LIENNIYEKTELKFLLPVFTAQEKYVLFLVVYGIILVFGENCGKKLENA